MGHKYSPTFFIHKFMLNYIFTIIYLLRSALPFLYPENLMHFVECSKTNDGLYLSIKIEIIVFIKRQKVSDQLNPYLKQIFPS